MTAINWEDPDSQITPHFTVREALLLPSWGVLHIPTESEKANILRTAEKMETIREYLDNPVNVSCWIRPLSVNCENPRFTGKNYNRAVGGAEASAHIEGLAVDFTVSRLTCDDVRFLLLDKLQDFGIRMERKPGAHWVHIDLREPRKNQARFFFP